MMTPSIAYRNNLLSPYDIPVLQSQMKKIKALVETPFGHQ